MAYEQNSGEWNALSPAPGNGSVPAQPPGGSAWVPSNGSPYSPYPTGATTPAPSPGFQPAAGTAPDTQYTQPIAAPPRPVQVRYRSPSGEPAAATPPGADPVVDITPTGPWQGEEPADEPAFTYPMRNGAGKAALVLGCLGLAFTGVVFVLFPLGIVFGLMAVVLGRRGRRRARYGFASNGASASAGIGLGTATILLGALLTAATVWFTMSYDVGAMKDCAADNSTGPAAARCVIDVIDRV